MSSVVILESIIYLSFIIILHRVIKLYLLNVEHYFDNTLDNYKEPFSDLNTNESWDEVKPIEKHKPELKPEPEPEPEPKLEPEPEPEPEPEQSQENNRFKILDDRFSINSYNNCNISNSKLNYSNLNDSELLNDGETDTLNKQFETYWTEAKNVETITEKTFDSIITQRNEEAKSYFNSSDSVQDNESNNINNINNNYLDYLNTKIVPSSENNTPLNNLDTNKEVKQEPTPNSDLSTLEYKPTNNSIELSDIRNSFSLESNKELAERVNHISAYDNDTFLAKI